MLLYEQILRGIPKDERDSSLAVSLRSAEVIVLDNVSRLYWLDSPQEEWDLTTDFPNIAPPWPTAFYEWEAPDQMNINGVISTAPERGVRFGFLVLADDIPDHVDEADVLRIAQYNALSVTGGEAAKKVGYSEANRVMQSMSPEEFWSKLSDDARERWLTTTRQMPDMARQEGLRWTCQAIAWVARRGQAPFTFMHYRFPLHADGTLLKLPTGKVMVSCGLMNSTALSGMDNDGIAYAAYMLLHVPFLGISLSHCKNVETIERPVELARKQQKQVGLPRFTYRVLEINPMRAVLEREGGMANHQSVQKGLHICRGHFKDYRQRGLFGRNHGIYWWGMAVRGSAESGFADKDYAVRAPSGARGEE